MLPPGSTDCHCHVYGPFDRFPPERSGSYAAPEGATVDDLLRLWDRLGIARGVVVHALVAGADNAATLDALRRHPDRLRGVAVLPSADVPDGTLDALAEAGFRGVRANLLRRAGRPLYRGGMGLEALEELAPRLRSRGLHAQVWIDAGDAREIAPRLGALGLPLVFDHMGRVATDRGVDDPGFRWLCDEVRAGRAWCKLSGADRNSRAGAPYADTEPFIRALVEAGPDRLVWGTDWPHVGHAEYARPEVETLVALFLAVVAEPELRRRILVDNPARLYGF